MEGRNGYGHSSGECACFMGRPKRFIWFDFLEAFGVGESRTWQFDFDRVFLAALFVCYGRSMWTCCVFLNLR